MNLLSLALLPAVAGSDLALERCKKENRSADAVCEIDTLQKLGQRGAIEPVRLRRQLLTEDPLPFLLGDTMGIADLHAHPLAELAYDRRVVSSAPPPCDGRWHGLRYDISGVASSMPELLEDPVFVEMLRHCPEDEFPTWRSWTHEQYSLEHLEMALADGLSLLVMSAVNNQVLCGLSADYGPDIDDTHVFWPEAQPYSQCTDSVNIHRQLEAAWVIDEQNDWFHVALTPGEANHAMAAGRLAVVLGVEGSDYLNPDAYGGIVGDELAPLRDPVRTAATVVKRLEGLGVSLVIPVHEWSNAVGGSSFQNLALFQAGYALTRRWQREDEWSPIILLEQLLLFKGMYDAGKYADWPMPAVLSREHDPKSTLRAERQHLVNRLGLTAFGAAIVQQIDEVGMILDLTHMSEHALADTQRILTHGRPQGSYPSVVVSHSMPRTLSHRHQDELEYPIGDATYLWTVEHGGVIGVLPGAETVSNSPGSGVANTCPGSTRSLAQMVHHLRRFSPFVAVGTDMNGGAAMVVPRLGPAACSVDVSPETAHGLALYECLDNNRRKRKAELFRDTEEFDRKGLAHVGLVDDLLLDIDELGVDTEGSWWTAQRTVDTWLGQGRAAREVVTPLPVAWKAKDEAAGDFTEQDFRACRTTFEAARTLPGLRVSGSRYNAHVEVPKPDESYAAWYFATTSDYRTTAEVTEGLQTKGIGLAVDDEGNFVPRPLSPAAEARFRASPSDACKAVATQQED